MQVTVLEEDIEDIIDRFPFCSDIVGKSFLITGGTGLIGSLLIKSLVAINRKYDINIKVYAFARDREKVEAMHFDPMVRWFIQDMSQPILMKDRVDFIIHAASPTQTEFLAKQPVETMENNMYAAVNLLHYAKNFHSKLTYLSSVEVYGQILDGATMQETDYGTIDSLNVRNGYPLIKKLIECAIVSYAKEYGVDCNICRLTQTFGPGVSNGDNRIFMQIAKAAIQHKNIVLHTTGESSKPYVYTVDAILGIFYILLKGTAGEAYNLANDATYISVKDMAQRVLNAFGGSQVIIEPQNSTHYAPISKFNLNTIKLRQLGWRPKYDLMAMYDRLIKYLK